MLVPVFDDRREAVDPLELPAARLVPPPVGIRRLARFLGFLFVATLVAVSLAPWQQNVPGIGRVIAFDPSDRQQDLQAPIHGRIVRWFVREGDHVETGDPIVEIQDNDPDFYARIAEGRTAVESQLRIYELQVAQLDGNVAALEEARDRIADEARTDVAQADQRLRAARQRLTAAEASNETAAINLRRVQELFRKGLVSQRELELAELSATQNETQVESAEADVRAAAEALTGRRASLASRRASAEAQVENARASRGRAVAQVEDTRTKLLDFDVRLARQSTQLIAAPRDSFVLQILRAPGQEQVKQGDPLAILVPDTTNRVAEIRVDGNDAAIISQGRKVRLQFEGWPAVQFAGWPSVAVGTFGGEVAFVDSADDGKGDFRIIVRPDPSDNPWPHPSFLRQGVRAKAWVLLDQVTLAYEFWRSFNGFPPAVEIPPTGSGTKMKSDIKAGKGHLK